ncbi:hypothetical protein [Thalassospira sp.]|uniref:hypothetical protein n=1 Tax=Thalassospira sp. TaxID=1912094 RepID=UPI003AA94460
MTDDQIAVLTALDASECDFIEYSQAKASQLGIEKGRFLKVCRELRDMRYAELRVLTDDCGDGAKGSAYARTTWGDAVVTLAGVA